MKNKRQIMWWTMQRCRKGWRLIIFALAGVALILLTLHKDAWGVRKLKSIRQSWNFSDVRQDSCDACFEHNYKMLINNNVCKEVGEKAEIVLVILIFSKLDYMNKRMAVRRTWASYSKNNTGIIRYAFLFGDQSNSKKNQNLMNESRKYQDILQENFVDSYFNLTLKTIMGFKWASQNCPNARFLMKTDDDTWINIPRLLKLLPNVDLSNAVMGTCFNVSFPQRDIKHKFYIPVVRYASSFFPQYCAGSGYVMSIDVATKLFTISKDVPFFEFEDVYVGLCLRAGRIETRDVPGFNYYNVIYPNCSLKFTELYTNHYMTPKLMYLAWRNASVFCR